MNEREPMEYFYSAPHNVDRAAFSGALVASAFAALLRLRCGKGAIAGWERYVGAASLGAFTGTHTDGCHRDFYIRMTLLLR